jgi:hypothetical protein
MPTRPRSHLPEQETPAAAAATTRASSGRFRTSITPGRRATTRGRTLRSRPPSQNPTPARRCTHITAAQAAATTTTTTVAATTSVYILGSRRRATGRKIPGGEFNRSLPCSIDPNSIVFLPIVPSQASPSHVQEVYVPRATGCHCHCSQCQFHRIRPSSNLSHTCDDTPPSSSSSLLFLSSFDPRRAVPCARVSLSAFLAPSPSHPSHHTLLPPPPSVPFHPPPIAPVAPFFCSRRRLSHLISLFVVF